jgi:hypothetical protein
MKVKTTTITEQNVITFFVQKKFGIEFFFSKNRIPGNTLPTPMSVFSAIVHIPKFHNFRSLTHHRSIKEKPPKTSLQIKQTQIGGAARSCHFRKNRLARAKPPLHRCHPPYLQVRIGGKKIIHPAQTTRTANNLLQR